MSSIGFPQTGGELAQALQDSRRRTLGLMQAWCEALPDLRVPYRPTLNLPLWEWGHVAWFQSWWIERNRQRDRGIQAEPEHERLPPVLAQADALYDSSRVAHESRWSLSLPDLAATQAELARSLDRTLALLEEAQRLGQDLYFWQLVLVHEDMHNEAAVYMAQTLGLKMPQDWVLRPEPLDGDSGGRDDSVIEGGTRLQVDPRRIRLGHEAGRPAQTFCFDNELQAHEVSLPAYEIDARPVAWGNYLAFVEASGHAQPRHLQRRQDQWFECVFGQWQPLDLEAPACYLSALDAQAYCDWVGRRLPTEAQWECAARTVPGFRWGRVWEWTSSPFEPYAGFTPHPYRDYSAPWFGTHRVLRGASCYTSARLLSPSYRNFFLPQRRDIPAGFRTVATGA